MNQEEISIFFRRNYEELVASGIPNNEAAAQAIIRLNNMKERAFLPAAEGKPVRPQPVKQVEHINCPTLRRLLEEGEQLSDGSSRLRPLIHFIGRAFSSSESLNASFLHQITPMEIFEDNLRLELEIDAVSEVYGFLLDIGDDTLINALVTAYENLLCNITVSAPSIKHKTKLPQFIVILECPLLQAPIFSPVLDSLFQCIIKLPRCSQDVLQEWFVRQELGRLQRYVHVMQQHITLSIGISRMEDARYAIAVMALIVHANDCRAEETGKLAHNEFYNDAVNTELFESEESSHEEFARWHQDLKRSAEGEEWNGLAQSLVSYPFVLDSASKAQIINLDSRVQMHDNVEREIQMAIFRGGRFDPDMLAASIQPFLLIRVHRDNIIQETLMQLAAHLEDLKKPLRVQFIGEEGVDAGGVRKEFFQVLTRQLLDPAYGMFKHDEETNTIWFNQDTLEANLEFELIGILLGIAIYNSVIIDVQFPKVVYKKLLDIKPTLDDLKAAQPELGKGLQQLLDFDSDVLNTLGITFQLSYEVFGEVKYVDLKTEGSLIPVTVENRQEYVTLYVEWVLDKSVQKQFGAFHTGFLKVCGGAALKLFCPEEVELLICGNPALDFKKLEKVTQYEDGYTADSPVIGFFWTAVHEMDEVQQKKMLKFVTGTDRAPINGLESLAFIISKNGDDSDRLPTSHTCFNHLLLPEYTTLEKLKDRLSLAIENSEGFGLR